MNERSEINRALRGYDFLPDERVAEHPALYSGEDIPVLEKVVHERFFIGAPDSERASQWWLVEHDADSDVAFGFVVLNGDGSSGEFGTFAPRRELETLAVKVGDDVLFVHRDLYWKPTLLGAAVPRRFHQGWWEK